MELFYIIVIVVMIVVLLFYLTAMGVMMSYRKGVSVNHRPEDCPDFWTVDIDSTNNINYCKYGTVNIKTGGFPSGTNGIDATNSRINFKDDTWKNQANNNGITLQCEWKKWCNANNIQWNGISNSTNC